MLPALAAAVAGAKVQLPLYMYISVVRFRSWLVLRRVLLFWDTADLSIVVSAAAAAAI